MSDLIIAIFVTLAIWTATLHEVETKAEINDLQQTASLLWMEGSLVGDKLKECRQQIRKKR